VGLIHRIDTKTSFDTLTVIGFNQERKKGKEKEKGRKKREEKKQDLAQKHGFNTANFR